MKFMDQAILGEREFKVDSWRSKYWVVRDGITWINLAEVKLHLWLCLGDTPINLQVDHPNHLETAYATGMLYPTLSTTNVNALVDKMMMQIKKVIRWQIEDTLRSAPCNSDCTNFDEEEGLDEEERRQWLDNFEQWTPSSPVLNWKSVTNRLFGILWPTSHWRYKKWHDDILRVKRPLSEVDSINERRSGSTDTPLQESSDVSELGSKWVNQG
ncbi:hypothetical protein JVT61DRAFT_7370 [Boletus reticuloceps]|uniref:Uncharacterized protein n=1 Tax=Boletus reticuloceps TaxID=495285 RepID=A0A8I3A736_9AGAM|nr:hypothetical protein JVT61DRAFT_7370 [Boletus reticuloceps]